MTMLLYMKKLTFDCMEGDHSDLKVPSEALFKELSNGTNGFKISLSVVKLFQVEKGSTQLKWTLVYFLEISSD